MSSFATHELESDGIHLTAYYGLNFMLHLFVLAGSVLDGLETPPIAVAALCTESAGILEDRVIANEQDCRRLNAALDSKTAED